jgi:tetratricopeptide (TPR) repeat protein
MRSGALALVATAGSLLAASLFLSGGSSDGPVSWIGIAAIGAVLVAGAASLWGVLPVPAVGREGLALAGLATAFVAWTGVTILWSAAPDRSWSYFNRGLAYLAFGVLGAYVGSAFGPRVAVWLLGGLIAATCLWALAGKAVPALYDDYGRLARLRSPVGYWNALAVVAAFGLPLAVWAATRPRHSRLVRAGAVVGLFALIVALVLTYSRGGVLAALVALGVWLALTRERFESVAVLVGAGVPAAGVLALALSMPGIAEDQQPHSVRAQDGAWFALAFVAGAVAAFALAYFLRYRPGLDLQRRLLQAAAVAAVTLVLGAAVLAVRGDPVGGGDIVTQRPERLLSSGSNFRWQWWKEAWHGFKDEPVEGIGAGSFELLHRKLRTNPVDVREVHNLPLQFAAETGLVGLLLAGGAAGAALLGAARAYRRLEGADRGAAVALAAALPAFLVQSALDYDWEFVALCGPLFFLTGFLLASGRAPLRIRRRPLWIVALVLVAWAVAYSVAAPRVAAGRVANAYAEIDRGSVDDALSSAKTAHSLDPLSIDPLLAWASAEESDGRLREARDLYLRAVELQPLNWYAWYQLGLFDEEVLAAHAAARRALERAIELDPYGCPQREALGEACPE